MSSTQVQTAKIRPYTKAKIKREASVTGITIADLVEARDQVWKAVSDQQRQAAITAAQRRLKRLEARRASQAKQAVAQ